MAANPSEGAPIPGLREQAGTAASAFTTYVQTTVKDPAARDALLADVKKHVEALATLTKEHLTDADKRNALLEYAKQFSSQAVTAIKDPNQRASLLDKLKATAATLQQVVQDPAKRQEVHDQLAATTHKLLQAAQGAAPAPAGAAATHAAEPAVAK